ncbi:MAG: TRAP transporter large permease subunit [Myxococcota bacterium]
MHQSSGFKSAIRGASVLIFLGLSFALFVGLAPKVSSRLVQIGEEIWPGYAAELRTTPEAPTCDPDELEAKLSQCPTEDNLETAPIDPNEDPFADEDPFAEDGNTEDPFADQKTQSKTAVNCPALRSLKERCDIRHAAYNNTMSRITPSVEGFRTVETQIGKLVMLPIWKHLLIVLLMLGAFCATAARAHIALRDPNNKKEHRIAQGAQLVAHLGWVISCIRDYGVQQASSAESQHPELALFWAGGFGVLSALNIYHLVQSQKEEHGPSSIARMLMVVPLYAYMGLIGLLYFQFIEGHDSGQAIFLHKFTQIPNIYLGIGLYIWAGMLFATTRVARLFFGVLEPLKLPPNMLAFLAVVLAAVPTAYSGASGIFVIAAGAVIFERLMAAGASKRMALAATAMSGSLGVVLRPCLVVVLIAVLNKQVTTDELFSKGFWVFVLTTILLLVAMLWRSTEKFHVAPLSKAVPQMQQAFKPLIPYILITGIVICAYGFGLKTWLNEQTAPYIIPGLMLALVAYERLKIRPNHPEEADQRNLWPTFVSATVESSGHIGALLVVMAASVGLGGVVERAEVMNLFPADLGGPVGAMSALVFIMVLVGMTMDALGAVVLVSVTLAQVAYQNGIDPVHFWMMVLVAFELGYLTPPVALNHLLARQVIGEEANLENDIVDGFWARNEHLWLPMLVMGTALLIVAFVPFLWY